MNFFLYKNYLVRLEMLWWITCYSTPYLLTANCSLCRTRESQTQLQFRLYLKSQSNEKLQLKTQLYFYTSVRESS